MCYNVFVDIHKMSNIYYMLYRDAAMNNKIGVIKEIDSLGRIVIPKEFRDRLKLGKTVEVVLTEHGVLVRNNEYKLTKIEEESDNKA